MRKRVAADMLLCDRGQEGKMNQDFSFKRPDSTQPEGICCLRGTTIRGIIKNSSPNAKSKEEHLAVLKSALYDNEIQYIKLHKS